VWYARRVELVVQPVGYVRSPFTEKAEAPRQSSVGLGASATVEVLPQYRDALSDLDGFERIWLLCWFDRAVSSSPRRARRGDRPLSKVLPPRSEERRGVFATRSPHRPNPIALSAVRLERVDGLVLHVRDLDLVDGTPVLDIKPYLAYADAFPDSNAGWLEARDPRAPWTVRFEPAAEEALGWIERETGDGRSLRARIEAALMLGPQPHAYRRIKETADGHVLAVKDWRARFEVTNESRTLVVLDVRSGYRERDLAEGRAAVHALHRAFVARPR
jgi:tRNA-Thr(GGU) m(6)t(6)A37 methyltransferase TsaA